MDWWHCAARAGGADDIDEAWRLARRYGEPLRTFPSAAAIAERAWLTGTADDRLDDCRQLLGGPELPGLEWARGELAMWLHRCGVTVDVGDIAEPYRRYLDGDAAAAADAFERLGVQYEAALALTETGATGPVRRGLDMLDRLGAVAVADKVRLDLRSAGVTAVPARRRTSSLANPVGLTSRQIEVLHLMDDGLTNAELAARLYLSAKTVDHHVSAILAKLNVSNRREAVRRGRALGITHRIGRRSRSSGPAFFRAWRGVLVDEPGDQFGDPAGRLQHRDVSDAVEPADP